MQIKHYFLTDLSWNLTKSIKQSEQIYGQNGGKTENSHRKLRT